MTNVASLFFTRIPMPPSSNHQYAIIRGRNGKMLHICSRELNEFKRQMRLYPIMPKQKEIAQGWVREGKKLKATALFFFRKERIHTLKGLPKTMDVSNRIKALHDELCTALGIDDKWFYGVSVQKTVGDFNFEGCWVEIHPQE